MSGLGSWVTVWDDSGSYIQAVVEDEPRVDAGVQRHIESGGTLDTLLDLTTTEGSPYRIRASRVTSWMVSTPETRRKAAERAQMGEEEERSIRHELGIWDSPEP